jgi:hypothetical protein
MPERAINTKSATGCLLVLIPAALTMSALFVAWPVILGVTLLIAGGNVWQSYEWSKTAQSIDPVFQQLIVQNRGEISPIDLSLKANISGKVSQRYLATRADEFGTGSRQHPDRGQVYYFVSISTLGRIFDDSERELELPAIAPATNPVAAFQPVATPIVAIPEELVPTATIPPIAVAMPIVTEIVEPISPPAIPLPPEPVSELSNLRQLFDEEAAPTVTPMKVEVEVATVVAPEPVAEVPTTSAPDAPVVTIIQSELAKRLDFTDWTRNRDPDGLAWGYAEAAKEYYRIDT